MNNIKRDIKSNRSVLILLLVAATVFTCVFFAARGRFPVPVANQFVLTALAPFQRAAAWAGAKVNAISSDVWDIWTVHEQNKMLRNEVQQLRVQNLRAAEYSAENLRLRSMLDYKQRATYFDLVNCRVIGRDAANWTKVIVIDKGTADGIQKNMAVITERGLVGCVTEAGMLSSKVELILDPRASVGTLVQRSRIAGIVSGDFDNAMQPCMRNIPRNVDVREGDMIVTSGLGGVYPKGILVGKVQKVNNDPAGLLLYAVLETAVDFDKLEDVAVIVNVKGAPPEPEMPPKQTPGTETNPASDLAAQRASQQSAPGPQISSQGQKSTTEIEKAATVRTNEPIVSENVAEPEKIEAPREPSVANSEVRQTLKTGKTSPTGAKR